MIDLNHSSGFSPGPHTIGDMINDAIDAGILKRRAKEPKRLYLGASQLGDPCARKLCYSYSQTPPDQELSAKAIRIFDVGHQMEDFIGGYQDGADGVFKTAAARWFHDAGFDLKVKNSKGEQFGWSALDGKMRGHIDGVFLGGPKIPNMRYPAIWETKALSKKNWNKIKKHGLMIGNDTYFGQVQINMAYLDTFYTLFTALNKDTEETHHELIEFDHIKAQRLSDRALSVIRAVESGTLLERVASNPDFYLCQWCDYKARCWS